MDAIASDGSDVAQTKVFFLSVSSVRSVVSKCLFERGRGHDGAAHVSPNPSRGVSDKKMIHAVCRLFDDGGHSNQNIFSEH